MAYEEPGVKVIQQLQLEAANIQGAVQALTLVGPMYEVFEDEVHVSRYDPVTGAGAQTFSWPGKKASSVVDLAGVRKAIAEIDSQLNEFAPYPLTFRLRDPSTSALFDVNGLTDVYALSQDYFKIIEGSAAATPRSAGANVSAPKNREFHLEAGGFINAGIVAGDRVRLTNGAFDVRGSVDTVHDDNVFFTPDGHDFTLNADTAAGAASLVADVVGSPVTIAASGRLRVGSGSKLELVEYTAVSVVGDTHTFTLAGTTPTRFAHTQDEDIKVEVVDSPALSLNDGDLVTTPGSLASVTGGLTGKEGARVALWVEETAVVDGAVAAPGNTVQNGSLSLTHVHVGRKISIWSEDAGDGAVLGLTCTVADEGGGEGTVLVADAGTPFLASQVGDYVQVGTDYARIAEFTSTSEVTLDRAVTAGAALATQIFAQIVRTIMSVDAFTGDFTVDGAALAAGTAIPIVLHRPVYRDLIEDDTNTDTLIAYSGSAVSSDTGALKQVPFEIFDADLTYELFPDYELLVSYRALDLSSVNQELAVYSADDLTALGGVHPANPLVWAAQSALVAMGTTDTLVVLQPVDLFANDDPKTGYPEDQDEALGYLNALDILSRNEAVYYLVPLTQDSTVRDAFVSHVLAMSAPEEKKERVCYLSYALPLGKLESTTGEVAPGLEGGNKKIVDPGQNFLSLHKVVPGNKIVIQTPAVIAGEYVVAAGSTEDELVLEGDDWTKTTEFSTDDADTSVANEVTSDTDGVWKDVEVGDYLVHDGQYRRITAVGSNGAKLYAKLTYEGSALAPAAATQTVGVLRTHANVNYYVNPLDKTGQADQLASIGQARGNRRVVHMWPDLVEQVTGTDAQGNDVKEFVPSYFAAAAEAGRDSVIPEARSSTGMALAGFTSLRHSNFYFSKSQLNTIAGGGWTILEQRVAGAAVTVRHLLTTDVSTVKTQELAFTKNVDNMAKVKRESVEPLLNDENGRINITQQFLTSLAFPFQGIFETFVKNGQIVQTAKGPPYKILSIRQDPTNEDCILEDVELNVPLPANRVVVTLVI